MKFRLLKEYKDPYGKTHEEGSVLKIDLNSLGGFDIQSKIMIDELMDPDISEVLPEKSYRVIQEKKS